ncbi:hypothetical protein SK128_018864, partial [Halocaridina rubra]
MQSSPGSVCTDHMRNIHRSNGGKLYLIFVILCRAARQANKHRGALVASKAVYLILRRTVWLPMTPLKENGIDETAAAPEEAGEDPPPFPDNVSEVEMPDGPKPMLAEESSTEYMLLRYICVVSAVLWLVSALPGIPILVFGSIYHNRCTGYRYIPIWFIVQ